MLTVVVPVGAQDVSRLCLTRALVHGRLSNDACLRGNFDRAEYGGHLYSDKAPGLSLLSVPAAEAVRLPPPPRWEKTGDLRVWTVRLLSGGIASLLVVLLVGRVAEGLAPGKGALTLVTCGAGTLLGAAAVAGFEHDTAALFGFGAFLLAWRHRPLAAGLLAGLACLAAYEAGIVALVVGGYILLGGVRTAGRYLAGLVPGWLLLGAYDWAAFGSPFHLSYRYVANSYASAQTAGFFGVHAPTLRGIWYTLGGDRGLLPTSPVLVAAVAGLVLLWRRGHRAEALAAGLVSAGFLLLEFGYFSPYGGDSPGPRFLIPAIPFAALGLSLAFAEWPRATGALATLSVLATTVVAGTWPLAVNSAGLGYRESVWGELVRLVVRGSSARLASWPARNVLGEFGIDPGAALVVCVVAALAALALATLRPPFEAPSGVVSAE